jgi:hypothetical protein
MHIEVISAQATASGTVAAASGDSLIIKNSRSAAMMLAMWGTFQSAGYGQVTAPSLHDQVRGYRFNVNAAQPKPRLCLGTSLNPQPQETLSLTISGSATIGDVETISMLMLYGDLPGVNSRMATWEDVRKRTVELTTVSATLAGAAAGYTGSEAINAESDLLKANRNYAVLGITTNTTVPSVCLSGPDTGNVRVAVPGDAGDNEGMQGFFVTLARAFGKPLIPVINSGNKASTFLSFVQDENNVSPLVTVYLALLS